MTDILRAEIETEIAKLESTQRTLHQAMDEFSHDLRRVGDSLERQSGSVTEAEQRRRQLTRNARLTAGEIRRNSAALQALQAKLAEIAAASRPSGSA